MYLKKEEEEDEEKRKKRNHFDFHLRMYLTDGLLKCK